MDEGIVMCGVVGGGILLILVLLKVIDCVWWKPRKIEQHYMKQGIRGPCYHLFIGNLKQLAGMMINAYHHHHHHFSHNILPTVLPFVHHWIKIYGSTFLIWFGPNARLVVSDPDLLREIFGASKCEFFEKIDPHPLVKMLEGDGLLSLQGHKWAHHRKTVAPVFHTKNLKLLWSAMAKSVIDMLDTCVPTNSSSCDDLTEDEVEVEVSEWFHNLTEDVIIRTMFGNCRHQDVKSLFQLQAKQMELAVDSYNKVYIPANRFLPTRRNIKSWGLDKEIKESLMKLIDSMTNNNEQQHLHKDLLGLMIEDPNISADEIVEECKGFLFAGKYTTSNLLTWTSVLLAMHPQWQVLARDEVLAVCGSRDLPSKDHLVLLKTLSMIMNESLRLYPPTIAVMRRANTDVQLGRHKVLSGTQLLMPILAVHHDQKIWGNNVNEFNPARFSCGVAQAVKHSAGFIPFGVGPRTCIGQNLAILQAKLALAVILQRYSFRLAPTYRRAPIVQMLLRPQHGAQLVFRRIPHDD